MYSITNGAFQQRRGSNDADVAWLIKSLFSAITALRIWAAAGIASLAAVPFFLFGAPFVWSPVLIVLCAALLLYNLDTILDPPPDRSSPKAFHVTVAFLALIVLCGLLLGAPLCAVGVTLLPLCAGLLYSVPAPSGKGRCRRLKDMPGVKAVLVSVSIAVPDVFLPMCFVEQWTGLELLALCVFALAVCFVNVVLCDIRDVNEDIDMGVKTFPLLVGEHATRRMLLGVETVALLVLFQGWLVSRSPVLGILALSIGALVPVTRMADSHKSREWYSLVVDGFIFPVTALCLFVRV
jgi:4-hydroxybenzoate polyprenyltransferase